MGLFDSMGYAGAWAGDRLRGLFGARRRTHDELIQVMRKGQRDVNRAAFVILVLFACLVVWGLTHTDS